MIAYKTFAGDIDANQDVLAQQKALRSQLVNFINKVASPEEIIEISEIVLPKSEQFTITVWYKQPAAETDSAFDSQPEAQSADVLSRSLHEEERRTLVNTMVDEHMIRSSSS